MKKWSGGLLSALILSSVITPPAFASETIEPQVVIKLVNYIGNQKQLSIHTSGEYLVDGTNIHLTGDKIYTVKYDSNTIELLDGTNILYSANDLNVEPFHENDTLSINNRPYLGSFDFIPENSAYVRPINTVYMEDYLKGVVPFEMLGGWNREALKTQAVAARTYAYAKLGKIMDDTISYQVYGGYDWYPNATAAVDETKGEVITYNHALISAVYSASNGGKTDSNANVWGGTAADYLPIKDDPFDAKTPWDFSIKKVEIDPVITSWTSMKEADTTITGNIKTWMSSHGFTGKEIKITSIPVLAFHTPTSGGRVSKGNITVNFYTKDAVDTNGKYIPQQLVYQNVAASQIRAMVGIQKMLSYLVTKQSATNDAITISGLGNGHGVGMSQWGAKNRADAGQTYRDILSFYYDGTLVETKYSERPVFDASVEDTTTGTTLTPVMVQQSMDQTITNVDTTIPVISQLNITVDNQNQKANVSFQVNEKSNITLYLKDPTGKILSYLVQNESHQAGAISKDADLSSLNNGQYSVGIIAIDDAGNRASFLPTFTVSHAVLNGWVKSNNQWLYYKNNVKQVGWVLAGGKWYYLDASGVMKTGWITAAGKRYYLNAGGDMKTGWLLYQNNWYFFNNSGAMATGWVYTGGKWYYLYSNGIMAHDTYIGKYKLGHSGAML